VAKRYIPRLRNFDYPIDCRLNYRKDRLIGNSTTFAGLALCLLISVYFYFFVFKFSNYQIAWSIVPLGVYFGHLLGSFIKRRLHKKDGEFVPVVDHGDYMILLGIIFVTLHYINILFAVLALLLTYFLHPLACRLAFRLKMREYPY
jgi:hypothetical protein